MIKNILIVFTLIFALPSEARARSIDEAPWHSLKDSPWAFVDAAETNGMALAAGNSTTGRKIASIPLSSDCSSDYNLGGQVCIGKFVDKANGVTCYFTNRDFRLTCLQPK